MVRFFPIVEFTGAMKKMNSSGGGGSRNHNQQAELSWRRVLVRKWLNIATSNSDYSADTESDSGSEPEPEAPDWPRESRFRNEKPDEAQVDEAQRTLPISSSTLSRARPKIPLNRLQKSILPMESRQNYTAGNSSFATSAHSNARGGKVRGSGMKDNRHQTRGGGGGGSSGNDKIDALGRLLTRILRHMASELKLDMRNDGFVKVQDLLKLNLKTFANVPLRSHTVDEVREAVRRDNKQRFSLLEENGDILIRANQGHSIQTVETESLLKPILSPEEFPVCVHGTYKKNLESILAGGLKRMTRLHVHFSCGLPTDGEVISGMRRNVNVLIYLDVRKALEEGMKLYISDNRVILTEGFDGVVPVKYFQKIESWPKRELMPF